MFDPVSNTRVNLREIGEALGETNRYYFVLQMGRQPYDAMELIRYYVLNSTFKPTVMGFDVDSASQLPLFV
jgi:hypothetical protein